MKSSNKVVIKKHKNQNEYILTPSGYWVRNFAKLVKPIDINSFLDQKDYDLMILNQTNNMALNLANIDSESIYAPNIIIVSDGYKFKERQHLLPDIQKKTNALIVGVNGALAKWNNKARMDYYIVNNPYNECLSFLSKTYYPRCIASVRTNYDFIYKYKSRKGVIYKYAPVSDGKFSMMIDSSIYSVDDYRNPICAAISFAFRWECQKLLLFCCDDVFEGERQGAEKLDNGLFMYPQHYISHDLIKYSLFWLATNNKEITIGNFSSGPDYVHIPYITEEELNSFF